nr:hypothetical protein [Tanacetum cinerariifolium]
DRDDDEGKKNDESDDGKDDDDDDNDDEEEIDKIDEPKDTKSGGDDEETKSDGESKEEETKVEEEESFDPILRTPEDSENDGNGEEDQDRVKSLEVNFSEFMRTNQSPEAVSNIPDSIQRENDEFLRTIDDNMKKIIKEQVKSQVKAQVTRILPRIEESVNAQLEAEVLTRSSHSLRTSYAVAADLSEMELKKILIEKLEGNKSIQRSDEQRNLYKALEEPSAGSDRGSKRRRKGGEHASASTPSESATRKEPVETTCQMDEPSYLVFETGAEDQLIVKTSQHPEWFSQPRKPPTPDRDWNITLPAVQENAQSWISELAKQTDACSSFNELLDTPIDFSNLIMNRLGVDILTLNLLAGPTYELMRGSCNSLTELEYHLEEVYKVMMDQLDWVNPEGQHNGTLNDVRNALDDHLKGIRM